ncbi:MAG: hypothetical protein A3J65_00615 [Candidatus Buchananbacteria bacterium RIFCSPHIGHO2_02_FULL_45_11b]|uniref:HNH nuclease domain-containing protein n=2 Tax=Candidatus Buchananiibacteriota TaxID=1817903 RepID=A0A1G1YJ57_9BACT|nr:MAG: hypothetical protein A3J65_00615 [Candidatus Buchananbacteria bacterium RIFCSPHIGHO2_02_FULL_45_11b]OGY53201.1 MAG: hypothetical protein A3B15_02875 [Candidatus Buchananbacteria bacterium RIFCSPLOWO2_01_FULL_45_31]
MNFDFPEDKNYFFKVLMASSKGFIKYKDLFDFRNPLIKRREFNSIQKKIFHDLVKKYGLNCQLKLHQDCSKMKKFNVDHVIPLATNELNKKIRKMRSKDGKKVPAQSFGSNNPKNLILACSRCNAYKKHRIMIPRGFKI